MSLEHASGGRILFQVGGLPIDVVCRDYPVLPEASPEYLSFVVSSGMQTSDTIPVELQVGEVCAKAAGRVVLEAGDSWTLRKRDGAFVVTPRPGDAGEPPSWEARIDAERRSVRVLCSRELLVDRDGVRCLWSPFHYPLDQVALMLMLAGEGIIVHAAGAAVNGKGVILAGPSRAGKTTISRLCDSAGLTVLSDDRVMVRRVGGEFRVFGTPWPGEGGYAVNQSLPLAAVVFLEKGEHERLEGITPGDSIRRLLPVASLPRFDRELAGRSLELCGDLVTCTPAYQLTFRPDAGAVRLLEESFR